jgi:hypothetical protein
MANWLRVVSIILKIPLGIFILASFGGSIYAAWYKIQGISWTTPAIMGSLIILYAVGWFLGSKLKKEERIMITKNWVIHPQPNNIEDVDFLPTRLKEKK